MMKLYVIKHLQCKFLHCKTIGIFLICFFISEFYCLTGCSSWFGPYPATVGYVYQGWPYEAIKRNVDLTKDNHFWVIAGYSDLPLDSNTNSLSSLYCDEKWEPFWCRFNNIHSVNLFSAFLNSLFALGFSVFLTFLIIRIAYIKKERFIPIIDICIILALTISLYVYTSMLNSSFIREQKSLSVLDEYGWAGAAILKNTGSLGLKPAKFESVLLKRSEIPLVFQHGLRTMLFLKIHKERNFR